LITTIFWSQIGVANWHFKINEHDHYTFRSKYLIAKNRWTTNGDKIGSLDKDHDILTT
jgi:hypothetical protein